MSDSAKPFVAMSVEIAPGHFRLITSVVAAAEMLLSWPASIHGSAHRAALFACHEALAGRKPAAAAREAFIAAAKEGGVFVREEEEPPPPETGT